MSNFGEKAQTTAHVLQSIALVVAGVWAVWKWHQQTRPMLNKVLEIESAAESYWDKNAKSCLGAFSVEVENTGRKSIHVAEFKYRVLSDTPPSLGDGENFKFLRKIPETATEIIEMQDDFLVGEYVPGQRAALAIPFILRKEDGLFYWFETAFFDAEGKEIAYSHSSLHNCEEGGEQGLNK